MNVDVLDVIEAVDTYVLPPVVMAVVVGALIRSGRAPDPADVDQLASLRKPA